MSALAKRKANKTQNLFNILGDEGFRLFFPLSAAYLVIWPMLWVFIHSFDLPFAHSIPPSFWHAHEMIVGGYGAALIGFITTAVPEWTDTEPMSGKPIYWLAGIWGVARIIGLFGADTISFVAAFADLLWIGALIVYIISVALKKRTTRLMGFTVWLVALFAVEALARFSFWGGDFEFAQMVAHLPGYVFLGLLGLALSRVTVAVTNLILDTSEETSPFRPHPGRMNLPSGIIAILIAGELSGLSESVTAFLFIAAGAAFLDRVGEAFIGREGFKSEISVLAISSAFAGIGLIVIGAARLGAPIYESTGLHIALMGGLGIGILAVFSIAGLMHCGQKMRFHPRTKLAFLLMAISVIVRILPDLDLFDIPIGPPHGIATIIWALALVLWGSVYWPLVTDPKTQAHHNC